MWYRRDALAAAAEVILAIERRARREPDVVGTVGRIEAPRGAVNTIPGNVRLSLDFRSPSDPRRKAALFDIGEALSAIAHKRRIQIRPLIPYEMPASPCDERLSAALGAAVERAGIAPRTLPSGAGHDAMAFRGAIPFTMLFVRCREGISHNPGEYASEEDIGIAAAILADFLDHLRPEDFA
jgi:allantoate deiminase